MASFRDRRLKDASQTTTMNEEISVKRGFHVPPLNGATMKESKTKRKDTNKKKKKLSNGANPSKNSEKEQQWTNGEMSDAQSKGLVKAKELKKSKNQKIVSQLAPVPTEEDKSDLTHQEQDSLRWDGVLDDPVLEAQRLEVYRANRRKRYLASKQAFLRNNQTGIKTQIPQN